MVDFVCGYRARDAIKMDSINMDNNLDSLLDLDFNFMRGMYITICRSLKHETVIEFVSFSNYQVIYTRILNSV